MNHKCDRNIIVYIPYCNRGAKTSNPNQYTLNMVDILKDEYCVTGDLAKMTDLLQILKTKAVFLNWVEGTILNRRMKILLLFYQRLGAKLIWVFHNKYPHDAEKNDRIVSNMEWLADHSDVIVLHSKCSRKYIPNSVRNNKKAVYIPHILYNISKFDNNLDLVRNKYKISEEDFVFTIFGKVKPYKNIEKGIDTFRELHLERAKLLIAGMPSNSVYAKEIANMCKNDDNIILDLHYLPDAKLDAVLDISDVVLMPYKDKSSMNSGVMIQAFSKGKTVVTPDICMARDLAVHDFFYMYHDSLDKAMLKAYQRGKEVNGQMGKRAREYICKNNNRQIVKKNICSILNNAI